MKIQNPITLFIALGISTCASFTTGCSKTLPNDLPTMKAIETYQTEQTFTGTNVEWPQDHWWEIYNDKQLSNLIEEGLKSSPNIAIIAARIEQMYALQKIAQSTLNPSVGTNALVTEDKLSYNYITPKEVVPLNWNDYGYVSLNINWEIDFWGKNRAALAAAISELKAAEAEGAQAKILLASTLATVYAQLAQLYAVKDNIQETISVKKNIVDLAMERYHKGLDNQLNVSDAQTRYSLAIAELHTIEEQIQLAKTQIAALIGVGPDKIYDIQRPTISIQTHYGLPQNIELNLLGRRLDIVSAKLQVEAKSSKIKQKEAAFYPNINLSAMIGFQALGLDNLTKSGSDIGSVDPAIYLPIFSGGALEADLQGAQASYAEAVATYNNTVVHALQDVANVGISHKSLSSQIKAMQESVAGTRLAYDVFLNRYKQGLSNYSEVLYARDNMLQIQKNLIMLETKSLILDIAMKKALGGGYVATHYN